MNKYHVTFVNGPDLWVEADTVFNRFLDSYTFEKTTEGMAANEVVAVIPRSQVAFICNTQNESKPE